MQANRNGEVNEWVYHTAGIYWYLHVFCYAREKLVAYFCFYFWKVIIFNPQSFSLFIQLPITCQVCLSDILGTPSWLQETAGLPAMLCSALCPAGSSFPPTRLSWVLPGSAKPNKDVLLLLPLHLFIPNVFSHYHRDSVSFWHGPLNWTSAFSFDYSTHVHL